MWPKLGFQTRNREATSMSTEHPETFPQPPGSTGQQMSTDPISDDSGVTVVVRGEAVGGRDSLLPKDSPAKEKSPPKKVSEAKVKKQSRLPALDDDSDV